MIHSIKLFITGLFSLVCLHVVAQTTAYQPLKKGEAVPDLELQLHTDEVKETVHLSDYTGKLVILDFWGTWCPSCIAAMPDMLALQRKFKDQIKIILVTPDSEDKVNAFFKAAKGRKIKPFWLDAGLQLPFVVGDSILSSLFPHQAFPTHVFINPNGAFQALTYSGSTTAENIALLLQAKPVQLHEQHFVDADFNRPLSWHSTPAFLDTTTLSISFLARALEHGHEYSPEGMAIVDPLSKKTVGYSFARSTVFNLYSKAYRSFFEGGRRVPKNRMMILSEKMQFQIPENRSLMEMEEWMGQNLYTYVLKVPNEQADKVDIMMQQQLDAYFGLLSAIEKRNGQVFVLKQLKGKNLVLSKGGAQSIEQKGKYVLLKNVRVKDVFGTIQNYVNLAYPDATAMDETTANANVDIDLPSTFDRLDESQERDWKAIGEELKRSLPEIRKKLNEIGLDLVPEERPMDMLVIRDAE